MWRKRPVSRWVLHTGSEKYHLPTACRFYSPEEKKEKIMLPVCLLSAVKSHNRTGPIMALAAVWPSLSTAKTKRAITFGDFWLRTSSCRLENRQELTLIINCCLLADLRSSALLAPPPAFFCVLRWIQFVLIEIQRVRDGKVLKFLLDKHCIDVAKSRYISY